MSQLKNDTDIMAIGQAAFLNESGQALIKKYSGLGDELFTQAGYKAYAEDLLERMTNPFLADTVERAGRDLLRKLAADDRIFGTMDLALEHDIEPVNMAIGAAAAVKILLDQAKKYKIPQQLYAYNWREIDEQQIKKILNWIWNDKPVKYSERIVRYVFEAGKYLN
jgi:mannitol-1-phosphate/altronate dehydrogenase